MTEKLGIDYSFARPKPTAIKAAGYTDVFRYLSYTKGKNITKTEATALHRQGLTIRLVWETTATRATSGYEAGLEDGKEANRQADALGMSKTAVLFYAVDSDLTANAVRAYFRGVKAAGGREPGDYGGIKITEGSLTRWHWQTEAWSAGKVSPRAHIFQRISRTRKIEGAPDGWDENVIIKAVPGWEPPAKKKPAAKPAPKHHPAKTPAPAPAPAPQPVPVVASHPTPIVDEAVAVAEKGVAANQGQQRQRFVRLRKFIRSTFGK